VARLPAVHTGRVRERLVGLVLFLPVPLVLWLFTRAPAGAVPSLGIGAAVMVSHRLYTRPWALRWSRRRCLWCGAATALGVEVAVEEPAGPTSWTACCEPHAQRLRRMLHVAASWSLVLRIAIFGGLAAFLPAALLAGTRQLGAVTYADTVAFFKLAVAMAVLPLGWIGPWLGRQASGPPRVPFPVHIQALIGTWAVMWLFRIVGIVWLTQAGLHAVRRL
jgi:hypothetical protein